MNDRPDHSLDRVSRWAALTGMVLLAIGGGLLVATVIIAAVGAR